MIRLETNHGNITIRLFEKEAPKTTANFKQYVRDGFYDGTLFHRVIDGFMVQGGGFDREFAQKQTRDPIDNEANNGISNKRGTLAMARTMAPHSATGQFFINVKDNTFLDHTEPTSNGWGYCVFGEVEEGMDVVDTIKAVSTGNRNGHQDVPETDVVIRRAYILED